MHDMTGRIEQRAAEEVHCLFEELSNVLRVRPSAQLSNTDELDVWSFQDRKRAAAKGLFREKCVAARCRWHYEPLFI